MRDKIKFIIVTCLCYLGGTTFVYAIDYNNICNESGIMNVMKIIGVLINILKIFVPLLIIVFGMIDFGKAVVSSDDNAIKKSASVLIRRFIAGVVIFFIPTLILSFLNILGYNDIAYGDSFYKCTSCMFDVSTCTIDSTSLDNSGSSFNNSNSNSSNNSGNAGSNSSSNNASYDGTNYHYNALNNTKFMIYNQIDTRWSNLSFPGSNGVGTVGERGCNIIATAVIVSGYDNSITPYNVYNSSYRSAHPYDAVNNLTNHKFNCSMSSTNTTSIVNNLKDGNVYVVLVYGSSNGGSSKFTSSQHYISIIDVSSDGDYVYVGNSYDETHTYGKSGWFATSDVLNSVQQAHLCKIN